MARSYKPLGHFSIQFSIYKAGGTFGHVRNKVSTLMFISAQFTIAEIWKQPKCPSAYAWIEKLWYIYTMEYYTAIKKGGTFIICNNMDGMGSIMLSEIS